MAQRPDSVYRPGKRVKTWLNRQGPDWQLIHGRAAPPAAGRLAAIPTPRRPARAGLGSDGRFATIR